MPWKDIDLTSEPLAEGDLRPLIDALLTLAPASRFNLLTAIRALHIRGVGGQLRIHINHKSEVEVEFFGLTPASRQLNYWEGP